MERLIIIIADNGRGFAIPAGASAAPMPAGTGGGHGLGNMMYRLKIVGGRCEVDSRPGQGTVVRLILPLILPAHAS